MFDHIGFGVSNLVRSKSFFVQALAPLNARVVMEGPYGVGIGQNGKPSLWLHETKEPAAALHIAFVAASRADVDAFYEAALAAGGKDNGAPGLRPHYHPHCYGAFVIGPDAHNAYSRRATRPTSWQPCAMRASARRQADMTNKDADASPSTFVLPNPVRSRTYPSTASTA